MHEHGKRPPAHPTFEGEFTLHWIADSWLVAAASALTLGFASGPLVSVFQWRVLQREILRRGLHQDMPAFLRWMVGTAGGSLIAGACVTAALLLTLHAPTDALTTTLDMLVFTSLAGSVGGYAGGVVAGVLQRSALVRGLAWILPAPARGPWVRATARGWSAGWAATGFAAALLLATVRSVGGIGLVPALGSGALALAAAWRLAATLSAEALRDAERSGAAEGAAA